MTIALGALGGSAEPTGLVETLAGLLASEADGPAIQALEEQLSAFTAWLQDLVAKLDLSALEEPLGAVADSARSAVDAVDDALVGVTLQAQALFAELESVLDGVDVEALRAQVEQAIGEFGDDARRAAHTSCSRPARDAVHEVIDTIDEGVDAFDPADIVGALQDVIAELTGVLEDPEVASAIGSISTAIEARGPGAGGAVVRADRRRDRRGDRRRRRAPARDRHLRARRSRRSSRCRPRWSCSPRT